MEKLTKNKLRDLLSNPQLVSDNSHFRADCPVCGKPDHFFINIQKQLWDCKKCGEDGNLFKLLTVLGEDELLRKLNGARNTEKVDPLEQFEEEDEDILELVKELDNQEVISLPAFCKPLKKGGKAWKYMVKKRGVDEWLVRRLSNNGLLYENRMMREFNNRVLFTITEGKEGIYGYLGRDMTGKSSRKYLNSKTKFNKLLFGVEFLNEGDVAVLVEGVFDWIGFELFKYHVAGWENYKAVVTFGKKFSEYQAVKLKYRYNVKDILVFYDYEALKYVKTNLQDKYYIGWFDMMYTLIPEKDKDLGDASYKDIERAMKNQMDIVEMQEQFVPQTKLIQ